MRLPPSLGVARQLDFAHPCWARGPTGLWQTTYLELEMCRTGSLGRAVYDHFIDNGFTFPGEAGGIPMVFHDIGHVLAGYHTDPQGEIRQAAFQAGLRAAGRLFVSALRYLAPFSVAVRARLTNRAGCAD